MDWTGKTVAVTGGARGVGLALAEAAQARGARVAIADVAGAEAAAQTLGGYGARVDVSDEGQLAHWLTETERRFGPVHGFFSNAGVIASDGPTWGAAGAPNAQWARCWEINVMASVYAARHVVPGMVARGGGAFVIVASAAGLLNQIGSAPYSATKHAAVSFAESLAITHGDEGLQVVCVCPQAVNTDMIKAASDDSGGAAGLDGVVEPSDVARETFAALDEKRFFALPHPAVADYAKARAETPERWLGGMRKLRRMIIEKHGRPI